MYTLGALLPTPPAPADAAAVASLAQAPQKYAQLRQPGVTLSAEGQLFLQAVAAGLVPDSADGYATFLGWLVPSAPSILAAGPDLYDWYAFKYRFVSRQPASVVPEAIRNAVAAGAQQEPLAAAFARIYGVPVAELAPPMVDRGDGQLIPKPWILSDQTDGTGRRTVVYLSGGIGPRITYSSGGPTTAPVQVTLALIGEQDPVRYGSGDDRLLVTGWYLVEYNPTTKQSTRGRVMRWNGGLLRPGQTGKGQLAAAPYHEGSVLAELGAATGNTPPPPEFGVSKGPDPAVVTPSVTPEDRGWTDVAVDVPSGNGGGGGGVVAPLPPPVVTGHAAPVVPGAVVPIVGSGPTTTPIAPSSGNGKNWVPLLAVAGVAFLALRRRRS